jgi:hypothetical protein
MSLHEPTALERLEEARKIVTDATQLLEDAQRILFRAGDQYVTDVWGDGVRTVIEITERITTIAGDLTRVPIEIDRLTSRDKRRRA